MRNPFGVAFLLFGLAACGGTVVVDDDDGGSGSDDGGTSGNDDGTTGDDDGTSGDGDGDGDGSTGDPGPPTCGCQNPDNPDPGLPFCDRVCNGQFTDWTDPCGNVVFQIDCAEALPGGVCSYYESNGSAFCGPS
jgi:hypothetical protein